MKTKSKEIFSNFDLTSLSSKNDTLIISSFNIQFLGNSTVRDDSALVSLLVDHDIVLIQELVSPPYSGSFPSGAPFNPDQQSAEFFDLMVDEGFSYILSEEDTGTGENINRNGSSTEWWVAFYRQSEVQPTQDLPSGFLAQDRSDHPNYERVPYAFGFRSANDSLDFVVISTHLKPGDGQADIARREEELNTIFTWIANNNSMEKDFIVLGDMNFKDCQEITNRIPAGYYHLNDECLPTNTNVNGPKPYDNVIYNIASTEAQIDTVFDLKIIDLTTAMLPFWDSSLGPYPGDPYNHNEFRKYFSDHNPIVFKLIVNGDDD